MVFGKSSKVAAVLAATAGTLIAIAAIGLNQGWLPSGLFLGITAAEMGLLAAVAYVLAIVAYME